MIEYELERLNWIKRQLALQQKYSDTPPGITKERAEIEKKSLFLSWREYEEKRRFCLTSSVKTEEEPFAGRGSELAEMRRRFAMGVGTVFLSGMGGIGKSALARAYSRISTGEYDAILWLNYDKSLAQIFADDGQLGISNMTYTQSRYLSHRKYAREKYERLFQIAQTQRLLIILDNYNVEDPHFEQLMDIPCDLLVTTRLRSGALGKNAANVLPVEPLGTEEDWADFYRAYKGRTPEKEEWEEFSACRASVQGHTLKMKLALSNPEQKWTSEQLARSLFSNFRLKKAQVQVLCELSYAVLPGIPEEVYLSCTEETKETLDSLKAYSLVQEQRDSSGRVFLSLHPVIAEAVMVTWQPDLNRCTKFMGKFAYYARFSWYRPREGDLWLVHQVETLVKRLAKPVPWRYAIYEDLATFLMEWEFFDEAEEIILPLYETVRGYYGENHQFTAYMSFRIATLYHDMMKFDRDKEWYERSFRLYAAAKPANRKFYHDKADCATKLERIYEYEKNYEAAHHCIDVAMEAMEKFRRDTETADSALWLRYRGRLSYAYQRRASIYFSQGEYDRAQQELDQGLRLFPLDEFHTAEIRRLQPHIYLAQGRYEEAKDAAARDLEIFGRYCGENYKTCLVLRELLGDIYCAMNKVQAADEAYLAVLAVLQEKFPYQTVWMERLRGKIKM